MAATPIRHLGEEASATTPETAPSAAKAFSPAAITGSLRVTETKVGEVTLLSVVFRGLRSLASSGVAGSVSKREAVQTA